MLGGQLFTEGGQFFEKLGVLGFKVSLGRSFAFGGLFVKRIHLAGIGNNGAGDQLLIAFVEPLAEGRERIDLAHLLVIFGAIVDHVSNQGNHVLSAHGDVELGAEILNHGFLGEVFHGLGALDYVNQGKVSLVGGTIPDVFGKAGRTGSRLLGAGGGLNGGIRGGGHSMSLSFPGFAGNISNFGEKPLRHVKAVALCRGSRRATRRAA